jgi:hypothetical protein
VRRDLIDEFGRLVTQCRDPTSSPYLDFFLIICQPTPDRANKRHQELTVDVMLSDKNPKNHLWLAIHDVIIDKSSTMQSRDIKSKGKILELIIKVMAFRYDPFQSRGQVGHHVSLQQ